MDKTMDGKVVLTLFHSPEKGARTSIYAATSPELAGISGRFYYKSREMRAKPITYNTDVAARLRSVSDELCAGTAGQTLIREWEEDLRSSQAARSATS